MDAPNIQLYDLLRHDLHMSDGKSLELMRILDKGYKSGVREDLNRFENSVTDRMDRFENRFDRFDDRMDRFERTMIEGFQKIDAGFDTQEKKLDNLDAHVVRLDSKIDLRTGELRVDIRNSKIDTIRWMIGIFLAIALMILGMLWRK